MYNSVSFTLKNKKRNKETIEVMYIYSVLVECKNTNLLLLKLKKLTSGLLKNLEENKLLLNLENLTSHCLKNPDILLVLLIGPLLIRTYRTTLGISPSI